MIETSEMSENALQKVQKRAEFIKCQTEKHWQSQWWRLWLRTDVNHANYNEALHNCSSLKVASVHHKISSSISSAINSRIITIIIWRDEKTKKKASKNKIFAENFFRL